ncbi:MAG TPA: helix-turn-helix domain-containing protein [Trebonia sp.]|nr:helix-turn-helix domain-containing protein [Trebonia sp.]
MPTRSIGSINPGDVDAEIAARAARRIEEYLDGHPEDDLIEAIGETGTQDALIIPRATAVMFAQILDLLAQGRGVQIFPKEVELTTQQAAAMLNVSRPYLIGLLESDKIPFRKVGRHRRIRFEDLLDYKRRDDLNRRVAADKLAELTEDLDLY